MILRLFGNEPDIVFALLGKDENSATFSLGWVMQKSPTFVRMLLTDLIGRRPNDKCDFVIDLQKRDAEGGFTDIELVSKSFCHLIIEAKRGWTIPSQEQLEIYSRRMTRLSKAECRIVSLSAATCDYAARRLPNQIADVLVTHRSWADIKRVAEAAHRKAGSYEEKLWLHHLGQHLEDYVSMQNPRDNLVYVVSLSAQPIKEGDDYTWIDVVEKDSRYFHPVGNRWPVLPPNYIGFRYHGQLQAVHHIDAYEVVVDLSERNPKWPVTDADHFVYTLGPAMKPARPIRTGNIYRNHRVRCSIDTLLSGVCDTISGARDETSRRLAHQRTEAEEQA
jgi:hypothetical protein